MFRSITSKSTMQSAARRMLSTSSTKTYALHYHYVPNMLERRVPHRTAHLTYAQDYVDKKILVAGGALLPEVKSGLLVLRAKDSEEVERFAKHDPYVVNGLVTKYDIQEWAIAIGSI